jgi:hypothetical protein
MPAKDAGLRIILSMQTGVRVSVTILGRHLANQRAARLRSASPQLHYLSGDASGLTGRIFLQCCRSQLCAVAVKSSQTVPFLPKGHGLHDLLKTCAQRASDARKLELTLE